MSSSVVAAALWRGLIEPEPPGATVWPGLSAHLFTEADLDRLAGHTTVVQPFPIDLASADRAALEPVEVLLASWGTPSLDAAVLDRLPSLRFVAYAAGSVKQVVTDAMWDRGIRVSSAAAANAVPVAEFTVASIVMIAKDVFRLSNELRVSRGTQPIGGAGPARPIGITGLKVGVVGASHIGRHVLQRLEGFACERAVTDPFLSGEQAQALGAQLMELDELCAWADIVTLHAPQLPSTRHMIDAYRLGLMRDGAWLVNTARGALVDTAALEAECASGRLCALIDTPDPEPLPPTSVLYDLPNVVLTPHIAGARGTETCLMGALAIDEIVRFVSGAELRHEVLRSSLEFIA